MDIYTKKVDAISDKAGQWIEKLGGIVLKAKDYISSLLSSQNMLNGGLGTMAANAITGKRAL